MIEYFRGILKARYFWIHLSLADLRARWRRSFFGILWCMIQPLGLTLLISVVFSKIFNSEITYYAPYILSGIIIWDVVISTTVGGSLSFVQADAYIKQFKHPLAIYTLRTVVSSLIVFALASLPLLGWVLVVLPDNFGFEWLAALLIFPFLGLILWPFATTLAYIGARFRDLGPALTLIMQAFWFVSPVYFEAKVFRGGGLDVLVDNNPIYHLLQIVRAPLLQGEWPTFENINYCLVTAIFFMSICLISGYKLERKVIFQL